MGTGPDSDREGIENGEQGSGSRERGAGSGDLGLGTGKWGLEVVDGTLIYFVNTRMVRIFTDFFTLKG